ncbi:hypothetical protein NX040_26125, partial [Escherichia coli]|nr:hypothetical protein [Escherichia coli]MDD8466806.1 hypothetical protein [Escherichia coli]
NSHIATLVDRKSRYTIILRLRGKDSVSVNQALTDKFLSLPSECSGQQKLATALEFFQYRFSDSFGGNPPLYSCGLSAL